jgi:hypothetical protein
MLESGIMSAERPADFASTVQILSYVFAFFLYFAIKSDSASLTRGVIFDLWSTANFFRSQNKSGAVLLLLEVGAKEKFDLDDVISSIVGDYRSLLFDNEDNINLNIVYEPKSMVLNADKERISQVTSNLLSNAIKFTTKEKGTIHVTAEKKGSEVIVTVKDTGQGIEPEMMPRLFTKFARVCSSLLEATNETRLSSSEVAEDFRIVENEREPTLSGFD